MEIRIRPAVDALNRTGLVQTFSSCEGHYEPSEQSLRDRNYADIRFLPAPGVSFETVEAFLSQLLNQFKDRHGLLPIRLTAHKLFTPLGHDQTDITFVLHWEPFNRFDPPAQKRSDTDRAIAQVVALISAEALVVKSEGLP
jgi:hypothetical protein